MTEGAKKLLKRTLLMCSIALPCSVASVDSFATDLDYNDILNPALTKLMIETGGFEISDAGDGSIVAILDDNNVYKIYSRFLAWDKNNFESKSTSNEVFNDDISCTIYVPIDSEFKPIETCLYSVELNQDQINDLANGNALVNVFFEEIDQVDAIPAIGGRFVTNPIQVNTFNLNKELNRALLEATTRVWMNCWDADPYSDNSNGFKLSSKTTSEICNSAKLEFQKINAKIKTEVLLFSRIISANPIKPSLGYTLNTFASEQKVTWGDLLHDIRN